MLSSVRHHLVFAVLGAGLAAGGAGPAVAGPVSAGPLSAPLSRDAQDLGFKTVQFCPEGTCRPGKGEPGNQFNRPGGNDSYTFDRRRNEGNRNEGSRSEDRGPRFSQDRDRSRGDDEWRRRRSGDRDRDFQRFGDRDRFGGDFRRYGDRDRFRDRDFAYDRGRYGPRYRDYRPGYRYYHDGWYYGTPFWLGGALLGGTLAAPPPPPPSGYSDHVAYCQSRYRSYDPASDTFLSNSGVRKRCVS